MVSCPLLTPPTFLWPLSKAFAAKGEGVYGYVWCSKALYFIEIWLVQSIFCTFCDGRVKPGVFCGISDFNMV